MSRVGEYLAGIDLEPRIISLRGDSGDGDLTLNATAQTIPATVEDINTDGTNHFVVSTSGEITVKQPGTYRTGYSVEAEKTSSSSWHEALTVLEIDTGSGFAAVLDSGRACQLRTNLRGNTAAWSRSIVFAAGDKVRVTAKLPSGTLAKVPYLGHTLTLEYLLGS